MKFEESIYLSNHDHNQDTDRFHYAQKFSSIPVRNRTTPSPRQLWICFLLLQMRSAFSRNDLQEVIFTEHTMCQSLWIICLILKILRKNGFREVKYMQVHTASIWQKIRFKFQATFSLEPVVDFNPTWFIGLKSQISLQVEENIS